MKTLFACEDGAARLLDVAAPDLLSGQLRIRSVCSLISPGTELHYLRQAKVMATRIPLGYCTSGYIDAISGNTDGGFDVGDRVIALGWGYALHAEIVRVPFRLCIKLPNAVPFHQGVFANLGATTLHALDRARLSPGQTVLVVGAGVVGQLLAQCASVSGARVIVADRVAGRLRAALACGADAVIDTTHSPLATAVSDATDGKLVQTVFLCIQGNATSVFRECVASLALGPDRQRRGTIVCVGRLRASVTFSVELGNIDIRYSARCGSGYRDENYIHGRLDYPPPCGEARVEENLARCVRLIHDGRLHIDDLLTHRVPFTEAPGAYQLFQDPDRTLGVTLEHAVF